MLLSLSASRKGHSWDTVQGIPSLINRSQAGKQESIMNHYVYMTLFCIVLVSLAHRCFHTDCAECSNHALWHGAADGQSTRSQVGSTGEESRDRVTGGEPASHCPGPAHGHKNSGLPGPPQGKMVLKPCWWSLRKFLSYFSACVWLRYRGKSLPETPRCWRSCVQPSGKVWLWITAVNFSLLSTVCVEMTWRRTLSSSRESQN